MPGAVRMIDICSGHGCFPPRPNITSSPNVFINCIPATRFLDQRFVHGCPFSAHSGTNFGFHNVFTNCLMNQAQFDPVICKPISFQIMCSHNVFVN